MAQPTAKSQVVKVVTNGNNAASNLAPATKASLTVTEPATDSTGTLVVEKVLTQPSITPI